jgi:hypothetical protein
MAMLLLRPGPRARANTAGIARTFALFFEKPLRDFRRIRYDSASSDVVTNV